MARYIEDHRYTPQLIPASLDELLPESSVARSLWAALSRLDFEAHDARFRNDAEGRPALNPRCLTAVWMLGMLRGVTSSVRLADLCGRDVEFRWLLGFAPVEKSTLCSFRKDYPQALVSLSTQVLGLLGENDLLPGKNAGVDGTIVRAAASRHAVKRRGRLERQRERLRSTIEERLTAVDGSSSPNPGDAALREQQQRLERALELLDQRGQEGQDASLTTSEPEAALMRQKDGSFAPGYNAQVVSDLDTGAIIHAELVEGGGDGGQLQGQLEKAQAVLDAHGGGVPLETMTADSAYHDTRQLLELEGGKTRCYVPEDRNRNRKAPGVSEGYQAKAFEYDETNDCLRCPQGQTLKRRKLNDAKTATVYQAPARTCRNCPAKGQCCPNTKGGRSVNRPLYPEVLKAVADRVESKQGKRLLHARWVACEGGIGRLKERLHWHRCRMWHKAGARAELLWRQLTHNLLLAAGIWRPLCPTGPIEV